ncbi:MAG: methylmalonyl-CoA epimerase [Deferribacteres bacterium]|nr:methylmalonyl-CoA epimerase [candidate division KSB1 bacterium]MCB9508962.1 methylmalonyl-CoA epimerase [Deferribacteres bacterium]
MKIDHIGIAVSNLQAAVQKYQALFQKAPDHIEQIDNQRVNIAMFRVGEPSVELLEGTDDESPISQYIQKRGEGIHHICFDVDDLDAAIAAAEQSGMEKIPQDDDRGAGGTRVAFLHPKTTGGVLIELVQKS